MTASNAAPRAVQTSRKKDGYLPTLDGWRAVAILVVILSHDKLLHWGALSTRWFKEHGERGVDVFFAISGLLICTRLLEEERRTGRIDLRGFYIRRVCRIQPAALLYLAVIGALMLARVLDREPVEWLCALLLVRNYLPLHVSWQSWYTGHYWSLSVEEHFYLFLPGFLVLVRRHRALWLGALVLVLQAWRTLVLETPRLQFGWNQGFHTDLAVGGILLAAWVALLLPRPPVRAWAVHWLRPWVAFTLTALVWTAAALHHGRWNDFVVLCTFPALVVATTLHPGSWSGRLLESRPLRFVGRISYSLYLWQMLFFAFFPGMPPPHSTLLVAMQQGVWRYPLLLCVSLASYYWVEKPFIRLGHRLARPAVPDRADFQPERTAAAAG